MSAACVAAGRSPLCGFSRSQLPSGLSSQAVELSASSWSRIAFTSAWARGFSIGATISIRWSRLAGHEVGAAHEVGRPLRCLEHEDAAVLEEAPEDAPH